MILYITYVKTDLDGVNMNAVQLDFNQCEKLLGLKKEFKDLFGKTLGKWDTSPIEFLDKSRIQTV